MTGLPIAALLGIAGHAELLGEHSGNHAPLLDVLLLVQVLDHFILFFREWPIITHRYNKMTHMLKPTNGNHRSSDPVCSLQDDCSITL